MLFKKLFNVNNLLINALSKKKKKDNSKIKGKYQSASACHYYISMRVKNAKISRH